jgi:hypothetical protein
MSYQRIQTPRIYTDNINWLLSLGAIDTSAITTNLASTDFTQGSLLELYDMKLSNVVKVGSHNGTALTSSSSSIYFDIDTGISTNANQDSNYLFLTHNLEDMGAKFRIIVADTLESDDTVPAMTGIVNAPDASGWAVPADNGWSLITWADTTGNNNQHIRLEIAPATGNYNSATLQLSTIQIGEYFTFPHSPDMGVKKSIVYDGVKKQQSIGGHTYANASHVRPPNWIKEPWAEGSTSTAAPYGRSGRINLDMSFSYLADTDVYPNEFYERQYIASGNDITSNLVFRTNGGMFPFLFQFDKDTATDKDSFLWCRLNDTPSFTQVANRVWDTSIKLIEEY